ncbi:hypothetical protein GALL_498280 [mine drainage metagenome]|uniref:Uncharacterized protein n=1 Tax=mine drainage metagenome TaxID=410659 RepID=A0A1J5PCU8_9ZZZZ
MQRIENHHLRRGGMRLGSLERHTSGISLDFLQRRSQRGRIAGNLGAATVGLELARTGNGHLDQAGRQGRKNGHQNACQRVDRTAFLVAPAEKHGKVRQRGNRPGHGRGNGGNQDVAMLHMCQFVRHHPAQLTRTEYAQDAGGRGHCGMLRIAACGKRIRRVFLNEIDPRHRQAPTLREFLHHGVELRRAAGVDLLRVVHAQHHLVAEPVAEKVHPQREQQRQHHALPAAQHRADHHEQRSDRGHQDGGFHDVEHACTPITFRYNKAIDCAGKRKFKGVSLCVRFSWA